jgi:hypothetical protein
VHVWPNGEEPESEASYARLIALGIDGYISSEPSPSGGVPVPTGYRGRTPARAARWRCRLDRV